MAACAGPYGGAAEGNKATLPGKGKIYLSHAQKADAKLMLVLISLIRGQSLAPASLAAFKMHSFGNSSLDAANSISAS